MSTVVAIQSDTNNSGKGMETKQHGDFKIIGDESCNENRKYFFRQAFVCSGPWLVYFVIGMSFGVPTVYIPQIRRNANSTDAVSPEMASWLSSIIGYGAAPWAVIFPIMAERVGRKIPFAMVAVNSTCFFLVLYFSTTPKQILIAEVIQGMGMSSLTTLSIMIITEYSSPKHRGLLLTIKSASFYWGVWITNAVGTYFPWNYITVIGICVSLYLFTFFFWPESPQWLASKGRFAECRKAHRWLRGTDSESEKELELLIKSQSACVLKEKEKFLQKLTNKCFYKPLILSVVMMFQYHLTGKMACVMYAIEIIKRITKDESMAYTGMLILDGVTVTGMYVGCVLSKFIKRRKLLFTATIIGSIFLFVISTYLYMIKLGVLSEYNIITICLLTGFSVAISIGPMIMSTSIYGELTPLKYRCSMMIISSLTFTTSSATVLKISPYLFKYLGMHGAFMFYGVSSTIFFLYLFKYLPETKDKTLQEIEDEFNGVTKGDVKELATFVKPSE